MRFPDVCADCKPPKRSVTCHSTCEEYLSAKSKYDAEQEIVRQQKSLNNEYVSMKKAAIARTQKRNHDRNQRTGDQ